MAQITPFTLDHSVQCGDIRVLTKQLNDEFGEVAYIKFDSISSDRANIVLFMNPNTGTGTIITALKDSNISCILAEGKNMALYSK